MPAKQSPASAEVMAGKEGIKILRGDLDKVMEKPETIEQVVEGMEEPKMKSGLLKKLPIILGGVVLAGALGVFAYYVAFPLILPSPVATPVPIIPLAHTSYFAIPASSRSKITFKDLNKSTISEAINQVASAAAPAGTIKEIEVAGAGGQVPFSVYADQLMNLTISKTDLDRWLEKDFTAFMYYDNNGAWPGYVLKVMPNYLNELRAKFYPDIEASSGSLYVSPASLGVWKEGNVKGYSTKYAIGTRAGESANYGLFGNYLIISTNFDGFKAAVNSLGL
jgi:hypothetical protein